MSFTQKIALLGILVASSTSTNYQPDSLSSTNNALDVTLNIAMVTSLNGTRVAPGYNGSPTGPTLRVKPGDLLTVTLVNNLEPGSELDTELYEYTQDSSVDAMNRTILLNRLDSIGNIYNATYGYWGQNFMNLHFHGATFDPEIENTRAAVNGGGGGITYQFAIPEDQPPGLFWYHNHFHGTAVYSMLSGLYGFLVIEGADDDITAVPEISQATEQFLMLGETLTIPGTTMPMPFFPIVMEFSWKTVTNGHLGPDVALTYSKGETVLFRAASASVEPSYELTIDGHMILPVAYDGYPVTSVQEDPTITIHAGSRAEFMVKFDTPGTYTIHRAPWNAGITGKDACNAAFGIPLETCISYDKEVVVATIVVEDVADTPVKPYPPQNLPGYHSSLNALASQPSINTREVTLDQAFGYPIFQIPYDGPFVPPGTGFGINKLLFDNAHIHGDIEAGSCETWIISSNTPPTGHTFHIHSVAFLVTHVEGVELEEPVWRDTFPVYNNATIHVCFPKHDGYLNVHCHMPTHQDIGMAGYYEVVGKHTGGLTSSSPTPAPVSQIIETVAPTISSVISPTIVGGMASASATVEESSAAISVIVTFFVVLVTSLVCAM